MLRQERQQRETVGDAENQPLEIEHGQIGRRAVSQRAEQHRQANRECLARGVVATQSEQPLMSGFPIRESNRREQFKRFGFRQRMRFEQAFQGTRHRTSQSANGRRTGTLVRRFLVAEEDVK